MMIISCLSATTFCTDDASQIAKPAYCFFALFPSTPIFSMNFCVLAHFLTLPMGNFFRNSADLLDSPNLKSSATFTFAPEYWAAMSALYARKFSG